MTRDERAAIIWSAATSRRFGIFGGPGHLFNPEPAATAQAAQARRRRWLRVKQCRQREILKRRSVAAPVLDYLWGTTDSSTGTRAACSSAAGGGLPSAA